MYIHLHKLSRRPLLRLCPVLARSFFTRIEIVVEGLDDHVESFSTAWAYVES